MTQTEYGDRCRMWPHRWTAAQASRFSGYFTRLDAGSRPPLPQPASFRSSVRPVTYKIFGPQTGHSTDLASYFK